MILADHCVYGTTIRLLRGAGVEVACLKDIARQDTPDVEVLRLAVERSMVLLTNVTRTSATSFDTQPRFLRLTNGRY
ncbi:MAG: DUF5615 family PIN-like protein, partial [Candidatus Solibacter usitatus]|nr:DUF5615 family PIN-like protein [Candidatus Solibacter usitatus]